MITHRLQVDMCPGGSARQELMLSQRDTDAMAALEMFASEGELTIENGTTAKITGTNSAGEEVEINATLDIANFTVLFSIPSEMTEYAGTGTYEIVLTKNGKQLRSKNIKAVVERAA